MQPSAAPPMRTLYISLALATQDVRLFTHILDNQG